MSDDLLPAGRRIGHVGALAGLEMVPLVVPSMLTNRYLRRFLRGPEMRRSRADRAIRLELEACGVVFLADGRIALPDFRIRPIYPEVYLQGCEERERREAAALDDLLRPENQKAARLAAVRRGLKVGDPDTKAYIDAVREAALEERRESR